MINSCYKMVALDLDGTLYNDFNEITEYTKSIIQKLLRKGIRFVIATGRNYEGASDAIKKLKLQDYDGNYVITYNGLQIYNGKKQLLYTGRMLCPNELCKIYDVGKSQGMKMVFFTGENNYVENTYYTKDKIEDIEEFLSKLHELKIDCLSQMTAYKVAYLHHKRVFQEVLSELKEQLKDYQVFHTKDNWVEIMAKGIGKEIALSRISKLSKVNMENIIAFGDGENDNRLLRSVGLGIAMANASESTKKHSDKICLSNNEDGVGYALLDVFKEVL